MVFRREGTYAIMALLAALIAFLFFSSPAWAQDCPNPRVAKELSGVGNIETAPFNIQGNRFRITSDIVPQDSTSNITSLFITVYNDEGDFVTNSSQQAPGRQVTFVNEGPGSFVLNVAQVNAEYRITVEDCGGSNNSSHSNKKKNNKNNKRNNNSNNGNNGNIQVDADIDGDGDVDQDDELADAEAFLDDETTDGETTDGEITNGDDLDGDDLDDTGDDGPVSATSGNGQAEASTPGAVARSGGDPDELEPLTSTPDNVVNEIPTSGPLPNTGGMSLLYWLLPLAGLLMLAGLPVYRWVKRRE